MGYVGLPLLRSFFNAGFRVMGFEVDPEKIKMLKAGQSYFKHLGEDYVREMSASDRFEATDDFSRLAFNRFLKPRPIWRRYYRNRVRNGEPRVNPWQRFLHWGLMVMQSWRGFKKRLKANRPGPR